MEEYTANLVAALLVAILLAGAAWGTHAVYTIVRRGAILKRQFPHAPSGNILLGDPPTPPPTPHRPPPSTPPRMQGIEQTSARHDLWAICALP